jgi:hypothetical protein
MLRFKFELHNNYAHLPQSYYWQKPRDFIYLPSFFDIGLQCVVTMSPMALWPQTHRDAPALMMIRALELGGMNGCHAKIEVLGGRPPPPIMALPTP